MGLAALAIEQAPDAFRAAMLLDLMDVEARVSQLADCLPDLMSSWLSACDLPVELSVVAPLAVTSPLAGPTYEEFAPVYFVADGLPDVTDGSVQQAADVAIENESMSFWIVNVYVEMAICCEMIPCKSM